MMDNYDLWRANERRLEEALLKCPKCCECGEHIQEEKAIKYNGEWYCKDCEEYAWKQIREEFLENTDDEL